MEKLKDALRAVLLKEGVDTHLILSTKFDRFVEDNQQEICFKILEQWDSYQHTCDAAKNAFPLKEFSSN